MEALMRKLIVLLILNSTLLARPWGLQRCINHALKENLSLQIQNEELRADTARLNEAKAAFFPSLSGTAGSSLTGTDPDKSGSTRFELSSRVLLFDGMQSPNQITLQKQQLSQEEVELELAQRQIIADVTKGYLTVLYGKENLRERKESVLSAEKQVELNQELLKAGRATKVELTRSRAQLAQEKYSRTTAENSLRSARLALQQLLELDPRDSFELFFPTLDKSIEIPDVPDADSLYSIALKSHPLIQSAQLSTLLAETSKKIAKGNYSPSLTASGSLATGTSSLSDDPFGTQLQDRFTPSVGISLSVPILNNRKTKTAVELSEISITKTKLAELQVEKEIRLSLQQLIVEIENSLDRFEAARAQFSAEEANLENLSELYREGRISYFTFLTEQDRFTAAQTELTQAKYSAVLNWQILRIYLGDPLELPSGFTLN